MTGDIEGERVSRQRSHLAGTLTALRNIVEAQPRLAALLAAKPALAPLLNCLEPICRYGRWCSVAKATYSGMYHLVFLDIR